ncbi:MAG: hypothetical protein LUO97_02775, partial [Methanomicrobiales archaeon]|nr:hypothetical protein [Methanomicrobiales archaeon]
MRRQTHLVFGAVAFLVYSYPLYLFLKIPMNMILLGFFAMAFGSVVPDVLEPARDWSHRGLGHSRHAMKGAAELFAVTAVIGLFQVFDPFLSLAYIASGFFLG